MFTPCTSPVKVVPYYSSFMWEESEEQNIPATWPRPHGRSVMELAFKSRWSACRVHVLSISLGILRGQGTSQKQERLSGGSLVLQSKFKKSTLHLGIQLWVESWHSQSWFWLPFLNTMPEQEAAIAKMREKEAVMETSSHSSVLWVAHSFQSLNRSSSPFLGVGSWGGGRAESHAESSCLFIITSLSVAQTKGEGC